MSCIDKMSITDILAIKQILYFIKYTKAGMKCQHFFFFCRFFLATYSILNVTAHSLVAYMRYFWFAEVIHCFHIFTF